ncbi:MAG: hypothetical protein EA425_18250 [Puniceicoccaceae bacterium]|nr:MAG: hypothetical protein EA425_18250 [Puniceicoccaceae bacterium]
MRRTKAVFLLHSGTFVRPDQRPGSYRLEARDGTTVELELTAPDDSSGTPPTIQDWWSIYPAITGENIRPWPIIDPLGEDSLIGHLHLLRWQPGPAPKAWRKLHIHGPDHPPGSLALLAVTLLLEPRRQSKD